MLARVEPKAWVNERTREHIIAPPRPSVAFCGLANPASFWMTLSELGMDPLFCWDFDDHHHYTQRELHKLVLQARSRGAQAVLTTEKDAMNLPERALEILAPLDLYWLKIGTLLSDETELFALLESKLQPQ